MTETKLSLQVHHHRKSIKGEKGTLLQPSASNLSPLELLHIKPSKFKFSFLVPICFQKKYWGEFVKTSIKFIFPDHVLKRSGASNENIVHRPVTRILCGGVLTRPKCTKLPKYIFYRRSVYKQCGIVKKVHIGFS